MTSSLWSFLKRTPSITSKAKMLDSNRTRTSPPRHWGRGGSLRGGPSRRRGLRGPRLCDPCTVLLHLSLIQSSQMHLLLSIAYRPRARGFTARHCDQGLPSLPTKMSSWPSKHGCHCHCDYHRRCGRHRSRPLSQQWQHAIAPLPPTGRTPASPPTGPLPTSAAR